MKYDNYLGEKIMLGRLFKTISGSSAYIALLAVFGLFLSAASIFSADALGMLTGSAANMQENRIFQAVLFVGIGFLLELIFGYCYTFFQKKFQAHTEQQLQNKYAEAINKTTVSWLDKQKSGDLIGRLQLETENASELLSADFPEIIFQSMKIFIFCLSMFYFSWQLTIFYLVFVVITVLIQILLSKPIQKYAYITKQKTGNANALAQDILTQRKTVKIFNAQPLVIKWYRERLKSVFDASMRMEIFSSPVRTLGWLCGMLPILLLCVIGIVFVSNKSITIASFMSIYFLAESMLNDIMHYTDIFSNYRHASAAALRIFEIIDAPEEVTNWNSLKMKSPEIKNSLLTFEHVYFKYNESETDWTLYDISFNLRRGEKIAFVGRSGCGKSTILKLVAGLGLPQEGVIAFNGKPYSDIGLYELRDEISFVSQDSFLFPDTIENNILMGSKNDISREEFDNACMQSKVSSFIDEIPEGIKTQAGERGTKLSGGQLQRVSIARALVKKAPVILFDEATSALDALTEQSIQGAIENLPDSASAIIVAHRLSTIRNADRIYVMDGGKIAEQGKHEELIAQNGIYAGLYRLQCKKEAEAV